MQKNRGFNIITGQVVPNRQFSLQNKRFASLQTIKSTRNQIQEIMKKQNNQLIRRKLGKSRDSQNFKYNFGSIQNYPNKTIEKNQKENNQKLPKVYNDVNVSLMNASKYNFDIISHQKMHQQPTNWKKTKKIQAISKIIDNGRLFAPKYTQNFYKQMKQFNRKASLCNNICQMQKTYGQFKFFRKLK